MSSFLALTGADSGVAGFHRDARFTLPAPGGDTGFGSAPAKRADPVAVAWAEGYGTGADDARAAADAAIAAAAAACAALDLSFARIDGEMAELLRERLQDTVMALCEATLVPFALDSDALAQRVERAVAMLARADDERVIRLNADDFALISPRLPKDWKVLPDPALERGALRVETQSGGVEDGPAQWRRALAEAFHAC